MKIICPECKNDVDVTKYPNLTTGTVIECNMCGITLEVKSISENAADVEIVDEGK